jgi:hypothetical protein
MKPEGTPVRHGDLAFDWGVIKPDRSRMIGLDTARITGPAIQTADGDGNGFVLRENSGSEFLPNGNAEVVGNHHGAIRLPGGPQRYVGAHGQSSIEFMRYVAP